MSLFIERFTAGSLKPPYALRQFR